MPNVTISPNMNMPVPVVGVDPGPDWATNLNSSLTIVDQHDHSIGSGVQITPTGLNINSVLRINNNDLTLIRSNRFQPQSAVFSLPADVGCLYEVGVDLYYRDGSGQNIRITQSGSIAGATGTIGGLVSPASATYSAGNFIFQANANVAANLDGASVIIRKTSVSSPGITLSAPVALSTNYTMTLLPAPPASTQALNIDNAGNMGTITYDGIGQGMTVVGADAIGSVMGATGANNIGSVMTSSSAADNIANLRTRAVGSPVGAGGVAIRGISIISTSSSPVLAGGVTLTTTGRPVRVALVSGSGSASIMAVDGNPGGGTAYNIEGHIQIRNTAGSVIADGVLRNELVLTAESINNPIVFRVPPNVEAYDFPAAGVQNYNIYVYVSTASTTVSISNGLFIAYEL